MKPIFIITGDKGSGKTSFLIDIVTLLQKNNFDAGGFVALHELQTDTYLIKNVVTKQRSLLMERVASFDKRPNHFKLFSEGIEIGNAWIEGVLKQPSSIAVIDEIGGFELIGELWSKAFTSIVKSTAPFIFTVKTRHLDKVIKQWDINPSFIFDSSDFDRTQQAFEKVSSLLR